MQANMEGDNLNPGLQRHLKLPSMFTHLPLLHIPISAHSSWSVHMVPSGDTSKPGGHMHSKLPIVFLQTPFWHLPSLHSSMSVRKKNHQAISKWRLQKSKIDGEMFVWKLKVLESDNNHWPSHTCDFPRRYPSLQMHLYPETVSTHWPGPQMLGRNIHSLTAMMELPPCIIPWPWPPSLISEPDPSPSPIIGPGCVDAQSNRCSSEIKQWGWPT